MRINNWSTAALLLFLSMSGHAQERKNLSLDEVMQLAFSNSNEAKLLEAKVKTKELDYQVTKDIALPESKISGTYMTMNKPDVNLKINSGGDASSQISTNQLILGQLSVNMPIYTGGKIKHSIHAAEHAWKATELQSLAAKQNLAVQALHLYIALYKAQKTKSLIAENIKKAEQQVVDFKAMEENGLIARNDLLKAELQLFNYKVAYQEAAKNVRILNYQLNTLIGIDENTTLDEIQLTEVLSQPHLGQVEDRLEIQALQAQKEIAEDQLKIAHSAYYPTIAATGGYAAIHLQNIMTVTNAANIGIGLSYDLGALYKNKKKINSAKHQIEETQLNIIQTQDKIKNQIQEAYQEVILAQQQLNLYEEALHQAQENYRIVKDKYDNGVADTDDLLEADVQLLQSEINLAIGKANTVEKHYDLLLANGQLNLK